MILINSTDLSNFAERYDLRYELSRFIRLLVHSNIGLDSILKIDFPSGEDVDRSGFDGILQVTNETQHTYIPNGQSVWEVSQRSDVKSKADKDFKKRTEDSLGIDKSETTFVFATFRKYPNKDTWVKEKKDISDWKDIRFYDALDFESWLSFCAVVAMELAVIVKRIIPGSIGILKTYWEDWRRTREFDLNDKIVICNRIEESELIKVWLKGGIVRDGKAGRLIIKAESIEEAIAFVGACVQSLTSENREHYFSKAILANDKNGFQWASNSGRNLIIIDQSHSILSLNSAVSKGHRIILPILKDETDIREDLLLNTPTELDFRRTLQNNGIAPENIEEYYEISKGDMLKLKKLLI